MRTALATIFALGLTLLGTVAFAQGHKLTSQDDYLDESLESSRLDRDYLDKLTKIRKDRAVRAAKAVKIDANILQANSLSFVAPSGKSITINKIRIETGKSSAYTWYGKVASGGEAILEVNGNRVYGYIATEGTSYQIRNFGAERHVLVEVDLSKLPTGEADNPTPPVASPKQQHEQQNDSQANVSSNPPIVDVLVIYTPLALVSLGDINAASQNAVNSMNLSFQNSQVNGLVRLAGVMQTPADYDEQNQVYGLTNVALTELSGGTTNTSLSYKVAQERDRVFADAVVMIGRFGDNCGSGYQGLTTPDFAFAVVDVNCLSNYTFAHELGHIIGADHNPEKAKASSLPYAHGKNTFWLVNYTTTAAYNGYRCWRTIMAYEQSTFNKIPCKVDFRLNQWSNPNISYTDTGGYVTPLEPTQTNTTPTGDFSTRNNARVLNDNIATAANFSATSLSVRSTLFTKILTGIMSE